MPPNPYSISKNIKGVTAAANVLSAMVVVRGLVWEIRRPNKDLFFEEASGGFAPGDEIVEVPQRRIEGFHGNSVISFSIRYQECSILS